MRTCKTCAMTSDNEELFVKNGRFRKNTCKKCDSLKVIQYQRDNIESVRAKNKAWGVANPERKRVLTTKALAKYAEKYPERLKAAKAKYRATTKGKHTEQKYLSSYAEINRPLAAARTRARNAAKTNAIPAWVNKFFVAEAYDLAARRSKLFGIEWNVDHIIPIKSKTVCGLHWEGNMQVIPRSVNVRKGNRYNQDGSNAGGAAK